MNIKFVDAFPAKKYHKILNKTGRKPQKLLSYEEYLKKLEKYFVYYESHPGHNITVTGLQHWIRIQFGIEYAIILKELKYVKPGKIPDENAFINDLDIYSDESYYLDNLEFGSLVIELFDKYVGL